MATVLGDSSIDLSAKVGAGAVTRSMEGPSFGPQNGSTGAGVDVDFGAEITEGAWRRFSGRIGLILNHSRLGNSLLFETGDGVAITHIGGRVGGGVRLLSDLSLKASFGMGYSDYRVFRSRESGTGFDIYMGADAKSYREGVGEICYRGICAGIRYVHEDAVISFGADTPIRGSDPVHYTLDASIKGYDFFLNADVVRLFDFY